MPSPDMDQSDRKQQQQHDQSRRPLSVATDNMMLEFYKKDGYDPAHSSSIFLLLSSPTLLNWISARLEENVGTLKPDFYLFILRIVQSKIVAPGCQLPPQITERQAVCLRLFSDIQLNPLLSGFVKRRLNRSSGVVSMATGPSWRAVSWFFFFFFSQEIFFWAHLLVLPHPAPPSQSGWCVTWPEPLILWQNQLKWNEQRSSKIRYWSKAGRIWFLKSGNYFILLYLFNLI